MLKDDTKPQWCPFCGSADLKRRQGFYWCPKCRIKWLLGYSRRLRQAPKTAAKGGDASAGGPRKTPRGATDANSVDGDTA